MPTQNCDRRTHRAARIATMAVASLALVTGCATSPAPPARSGSAPTTTLTSVPRTTTALPPPTHTGATAAAGASSPVDVAQRWLAAYRSMSWIDGTPTAWIERVRPYVTATLDAHDEQYADAEGGADWRAVVAGECSSTVTDLGAVIPSESPGTATAVNVEVTGTVHTACDDGQVATPTETASATLVVIHLPDGSWRVDQRLY